ncbi:phosphate transport system protein [Alicyclobacillus sacchari]|uniref:Phosphate-specific transport system accessory protein PhoU n=1 Tax=Alicyclobacillus sacchari TaxID=392010 RepID=A0A4R8LNR3_9BACL|nr:phosphate signaling complex protein PhoU [Alicyclobacillus sacchari]TDY47912.1 phosphate transport system protein [Alicyclobacillus sacchari]GMA56018.1 phosphate transport system regulatory protein PhoU [Alicyclobacillus sacchari]
MQQRQAFDIALKELKWKLLRMGGDIQEAIRRAIAALETQDTALAQAVVDGDANINGQDHDVEDLCIRLIATQQPVAGDLRRIVAGMRLAMDLERMGDLAVDIAKSVLRMGAAPSAQAWEDIRAMAKMVDAMIAEALNAYVDSDVEAAKRLAQMDDEIDHHYRHLVEQLFSRSTSTSENTTTPQAMATAFCGRYLERIGDHVTNIGESVIYIISGERSDLN